MSQPGARPDPTQCFRERFSADPTYRVRSPGRVNLIGEHIDYVGLPVFPVALRQGFEMALRPRDDATIRVVNTDDHYGERSFTVSAEMEAGPPGDWENYLKAAARHLARRHGELKGFDAAVDSDIPVAAGLSSSAALVVAAALALDTVNDLRYAPIALAGAMAAAERFVGTRGGGMDHAICLGAEEGHAARIDFGPLRLAHTAVPAGWRFVVANTLVQAEKSAGAREAYNRRTRECEEALQRVRAAMGESVTVGYPQLLTHHEVIELFTVAERALAPPLLKRFRHVVTEGVRVRRAEIAMARDDIRLFGSLMGASHESLRDDYSVSSPELNRLCSLARDAGAHGARLTGAGFGGCVVALCDAGSEQGLLDTFERGYYAGMDGLPPPEERSFIVEPSRGAGITWP